MFKLFLSITLAPSMIHGMQGWAQSNAQTRPRPGLAAGIFGRSDSIMLCITLPGPSWLTCKDKGEKLWLTELEAFSGSGAVGNREVRNAGCGRGLLLLRRSFDTVLATQQTHEDSGHERVLCDVLYCFCVVKICLFGKQLVRGTCVPLSFS